MFCILIALVETPPVAADFFDAEEGLLDEDEDEDEERGARAAATGDGEDG